MGEARGSRTKKGGMYLTMPGGGSRPRGSRGNLNGYDGASSSGSSNASKGSRAKSKKEMVAGEDPTSKINKR